MKNKKGLTVSIGMLVMIILSILIFSLAVYFLFKWFGEAEIIKAEIDKRTQEQIITALKTGTQLVAIPISMQEVKRGTDVTFGVGIRNIGDTGPFSMAVKYSGAFYPDGGPINVDQQYIGDNWLGATFAVTETFELKRNEQKLMPVLIKTDPNIAPGRRTPKGDYVFNVCVYDSPSRSVTGGGAPAPPAPCDLDTFKNRRGILYTKKIYQVTVKVV